MLDKIEIGKTSVSVTRGLIKRKGVREKNSFFFEQFSACSLLYSRFEVLKRGLYLGSFFIKTNLYWVSEAVFRWGMVVSRYWQSRAQKWTLIKKKFHKGKEERGLGR